MEILNIVDGDKSEDIRYLLYSAIDLILPEDMEISEDWGFEIKITPSVIELTIMEPLIYKAWQQERIRWNICFKCSCHSDFNESSDIEQEFCET